MDAIIIIILLVVNIPVYKIISKFIFKDSDDFKESVQYSFTPDIFSLFKGRFWKDQIGESKLSIFLLLCFMAIAIEFMVIKAIIGAFI